MRYLRLLRLQLRLSATLGMQYRLNFIIDGIVSLLSTGLGLVPLYIAFHGRAPMGGWTFDTALVVVGWFTLLRAVLEGGINPSLVAVVERVRDGTLDFVLMKPADAQFLVSTAKFEVWKVIDVGAALAILGWAFAEIGRPPAALHVALSLVLLACGAAVLYSMWILVVAASFWVVRLDNLIYLFNSIFDFSRWPVSVFRGGFRIVFTYVIPLGLMTTYPAEALLGRLSASTAVTAVTGALVFAVVARGVWGRALRHYASASS